MIRKEGFFHFTTTEGDTMIEPLSQMQVRLQTMRDIVLEESSVMPRKKCSGPSLDAKKMRLRHFARVAAAVTGAYCHMSYVEHVDLFSAKEKERMRKQIIKRLHQDLKWLRDKILEFWICLRLERYEAEELPREEVAERRQALSETLDQLEVLNREVDEMWGELDPDVALLARAWPRRIRLGDPTSMREGGQAIS
jgi:hypothetical protein